MMAKVKKITKACKICKESKYDRHPNKIEIFETPIPQYPGQIVHIDIFITEKKTVLTAIDKFSKYAQARLLKSRSSEDIKEPLREILLTFGMPETVVMDNEKSFNSTAIKFMLENQFNIKVFRTPPYASSTNGQIERFHSTLTEIMRCLRAENVHQTFSELLYKSLYEYNNSVHTTTLRKPSEIFLCKNRFTQPDRFEKDRQEIIERIREKQAKDLEFHNKKKSRQKNYEVGQEIYVKANKRLGTKLSKNYRKELVKEDRHTTVVTESGKVVHKNNIRS